MTEIFGGVIVTMGVYLGYVMLDNSKLTSDNYALGRENAVLTLENNNTKMLYKAKLVEIRLNRAAILRLREELQDAKDKINNTPAGADINISFGG